MEEQAALPAVDIEYAEHEFCIRVMTVLELCNGSLADLIKAGSMSWRRRLEVCCQVAAGMRYLHSKGMYHRDRKPGNVLIGTDAAARIADFGLSRVAGSDPEPSEQVQQWSNVRDTGHGISNQTEQTSNVGTPGECDPSFVPRR